MPRGLNRTDLNTTGTNYLHGNSVVEPVIFGQPVTLPKNFGNSVTLPKNFGNPVTWAPSPAHFGNIIGASISFVGAGSTTFKSTLGVPGNIPVTLTYASTAGNTLVLFTGTRHDAGGVVLSVVDSAGNAWVFQGANSPTSTLRVECWTTQNTQPITRVTVTFTGDDTQSGYGVSVLEYSNVVSFGALVPTANMASNQTTITQNTTQNNDWIAAGFTAVDTGEALVFSSNTGNLRAQSAQSVENGVAIGDNNSAVSGTPVTITFNLDTARNWIGMSIELLS
jgi:hypothetical protein